MYEDYVEEMERNVVIVEGGREEGGVRYLGHG